VIVKKDTLVWIGPQDHDLSRHSHLPFIAFDQNCFYRHWLETCTPDLGRPLRVVMECASVAGIIEAVRAGLGYALVSKSRVPNGVVEVTTGIDPPTQVAHVVRSQVQALGRAARMLVKELETEFSNFP
jgi:DNA-binding transcriptional LysR family regulator